MKNVNCPHGSDTATPTRACGANTGVESLASTRPPDPHKGEVKGRPSSPRKRGEGEVHARPAIPQTSTGSPAMVRSITSRSAKAELMRVTCGNAVSQSRWIRS